jgi:hypothetical protein
MSFLESDNPAVFASGRAVSGQTDDATALAWRFLHSVATAADFTEHPTVVAAIERYHATWQPRVNQVASDVQALGGNTSAGATTIAASDADAASVLAPVATTTTTQGTHVQRPINGPI